MTHRSETVTFNEIEAIRRDEESTHVCGNCRNPWTRYGRPDCKNAKEHAS